MGAVPDWYPLVRAARYLGVAPWELEQRSDGLWWQLVAQAAEKAEARAQQAHNG